jgi:hypothetical protein
MHQNLLATSSLSLSSFSWELEWPKVISFDGDGKNLRTMDNANR